MIGIKRFLLIFSTLVFTLSFVSCEDENVIEVSEPVSSVEVSKSEKATLQECHSGIKLVDNPVVTRFSLSAECVGDIKTHAKIIDIKSMQGDIAGDFGVSVELEYNDIENPVISFNYDKKQLFGLPEENLIILHYDENSYNEYSEIKSVLDKENCTITAEISTGGIYVLADIYQWYDYIGKNNSEYEYFSYKDSQWVNEYDTGDIMELADIEWAMENAPDFHVSTPEQLASVVWYANTVLMTEISLTLEDDIDLTGYEWKSMNWQYNEENQDKKHAFRGLVEGNGHTINGMKVHENNCYDVGFLGFAVNTTMQNINFTNADVSADYAVGIACGKLYADEEAKVEWKNVHVSGRVTAYDEYGAIAGLGDRYWFAPFTDCTADVTVNDEPFEYLTYDEKREADRIALQDIFTITLNTDGTITRDDHDGFIDLGWTVTKNNASCQLPLDAVENPVYSIDEAIAPYYTGKHPHPEGTYEIYLTGRTDPNEHTQRVSNVITHIVGEE